MFKITFSLRATSLFLLFIFTFYFNAIAQDVKLKGYVKDAENVPLEFVEVASLDNGESTTTNGDGYYELFIPSGKSTVLFFMTPTRDSVILTTDGERELVYNHTLKQDATLLGEIEIKEHVYDKGRSSAGKIALDPVALAKVPTPFMDFNQTLASVGVGIVSNNELSSTYNVRGGNYDENLTYVNGMEVYRPFLVKTGQQEGLSFINPFMVSQVDFSAGGWQPRYGDKLSSVLDVTYKRPTHFGVQLSASLLGGNLTVEGASKNKKLTYVVGGRVKSARYLLQTTEIEGQYLPRFFDFQTYLSYDISAKGKPKNTTTIGLLGYWAANQYEVFPETRETNFGTLQQAFKLQVGFDGAEYMYYNTLQTGLDIRHNFSERVSSKLILSYMGTKERDFQDLEAGFRICDVGIDPSSNDFNKCVTTRGLGAGFDYARNILDAQVISVTNHTVYDINNDWELKGGFRIDQEQFDDVLYEYKFADSADYVNLEYSNRSDASIINVKSSAYAQITRYIDTTHVVTVGTRITNRSLNGETFLSPRMQYALIPHWKNDIVFRAAIGMYYQPPFYREMRDFEGNLNTKLKAQGSMHYILGMDYNLQVWGRPFKLLAEGYYKDLWNVVPYDVDNVRLTYYANNEATAKIYGADLRFSGEFVQGMESWFNISYLNATENLNFDNRGDIRRPTDQRLTFSIFFQDYLPLDPTFKMNMRLLYGTGFPYGPPNSLTYRNSLDVGTQYSRVDLGLSKVIFLRSKNTVNHKFLESIWLGIEVLNLFGAKNNISYSWVKDFENNSYAIPNSLSQRYVNARMVIKY